MAASCTSQTPATGRGVRNCRTTRLDTSKYLGRGTRNSERIAKRATGRRSPCAETKEQQNNPPESVDEYLTPRERSNRTNIRPVRRANSRESGFVIGLSKTAGRQKLEEEQRSDFEIITAKRRSPQLGHKRSSSSLATETDASGDPKASSEKKSYRDGQVVIDLKEFGSFMEDHREGITAESKRLCQKLLTAPQEFPEDTNFSDDFFPDLCKMVKGRNEATVLCYIRPELVPSLKIRRLRGAEHLVILNETIDAIWIDAERCCYRRPQPDYSIGIDRDAFSRERLRKVEPFLGSQLDEESKLAATFDTCFPFLTTEVKCGAVALDIADRQNAVSQTIGLRGLVTLFRLVKRETELHRKVLGFSISHDNDNETVRTYGHYPFIDGKTESYHRCIIDIFNILPTLNGDKRWQTQTFVQNVQDLWAVKHFELICSAIDMLGVESEESSQQSVQDSGHSGLSQQLEGSDIAEEPQVNGVTSIPDASTQNVVGRKKKKPTGTVKP